MYIWKERINHFTKFSNIEEKPCFNWVSLIKQLDNLPLHAGDVKYSIVPLYNNRNKLSVVFLSTPNIPTNWGMNSSRNSTCSFWYCDWYILYKFGTSRVFTWCTIPPSVRTKNYSINNNISILFSTDERHAILQLIQPGPTVFLNTVGPDQHSSEQREFFAGF